MAGFSDKEGIFAKFECENLLRFVVIEDNGLVCYAYMLDSEGEVRSDVWLYNRLKTPADPAWTSIENAPFANCYALARNDCHFSLPDNEHSFKVSWNSGGGAVCADIYLNGLLIGRLRDGAKPGWALMAVQDGPPARALNTKAETKGRLSG